ncbi:MAG: xylan esterase, partial [Prolixibacteraceae bacterium]|nr:xylan esterase [Prolixibacteraceae bacterium]
MKFFALVFSLCLLLITNSIFSQETQKSVFHANRGNENNWLEYKNNNQALYDIITNKAFKLLEERTERVNKLKTRGNWINYQNELKTKLFVSLDKFEKTPLNPKITGKIKRDNFTVEKILFESHPNFHVTACFFLPNERQKPAPAVIYCSGHTELGFRSEVYQRVILNLVEKGFIVFAFDPIGQGERLQYPDPKTNKSMVGSSTKEHTYAGVQTLLTGTSLTDYFIWEGVRVLDYLETRKEVDMKRIGITGRSGGGTQSAMIAAYDERIYASAPECYITTFERLLQSIGPQDAEQNPYNAIANGFDHPDFMHLRVPKPTLIVTTTHDFFSQQGARESFAEAQKSYTAFNKSENIGMVEDFGVHESTKNNRESVYAFFQEHLKLPGDNTDKEMELFTVEELFVTETGQLGNSIKGETVFNLNQKYFEKKEIPQNELKEKIREISGIKFNREMKSAVYTGKFVDDDFEVEKYFLENDQKDFALPVYLIQNPEKETKNILVWLHAEGKEKVLESVFLPEMLKNGFTVISADLPGIGELFDPGFSGDGFIKKVPFNYTFGANMAGLSVPG